GFRDVLPSPPAGGWESMCGQTEFSPIPGAGLTETRCLYFETVRGSAVAAQMNRGFQGSPSCWPGRSETPESLGQSTDMLYSENSCLQKTRGPSVDGPREPRWGRNRSY